MVDDGGGTDYLWGGAGNDTFLVKDFEQDNIDGGDDYDTCLLANRDDNVDVLTNIEVS